MKKNVIELAERVEDVVGEWRPHPSGADYLIRLVPAPELRRIRNKTFGRDLTVLHTKEGRKTSFNQDKTEDGLIERACIALVDSRPGKDEDGQPFPGFRVSGAALAEKFSAALGKPVKSGDLVQLHGQWTPPAKELVLGLATDLRDWIIEALDEGDAGRAEDEEGKDES